MMQFIFLIPWVIPQIVQNFLIVAGELSSLDGNQAQEVPMPKCWKLQKQIFISIGSH